MVLGDVFFVQNSSSVWLTLGVASMDVFPPVNESLFLSTFTWFSQRGLATLRARLLADWGRMPYGPWVPREPQFYDLNRLYLMGCYSGVR